MTAKTLKEARQRTGWTQTGLARELGVTQAYMSLMESGKRPVSDRLTQKVVRLLRLPPTELPLAVSADVETRLTATSVGLELARLGYPGFAYLRKPGRSQNPALLLLGALGLAELDSRLAEALPWLLLRFERLNLDALVAMSKAKDLQNRLGFAVALAHEVAERNPSYTHRTSELRQLAERLDSSRLAKEDTFGRRDTSDRLRAWVRDNRSDAAKHWNLLTDLKVEHLPYANHDS
jgi:transcriptional regulator with XRE-family HTH domain